MNRFLTFKIYESPKVGAAYHFAAKAHVGQRRKYTGEPYIIHPVEVATILCGIGCEDEDMICAALLHDVVEDCEVSLEQIIANFGERVGQLVDDLTEREIEGNRAQRKWAECRRLSKVSKDAKTIKCCDLVSNTKDIAEHDKKFAKVYLAEKKQLLCGALHDADVVAYHLAFRAWRQANGILESSDQSN